MPASSFVEFPFIAFITLEILKVIIFYVPLERDHYKGENTLIAIFFLYVHMYKFPVLKLLALWNLPAAFIF